LSDIFVFLAVTQHVGPPEVNNLLCSTVRHSQALPSQSGYTSPGRHPKRVRNEAEPTRNDLPGGEECWLSYPQPNVSLQQQMTPDMKQFRISMLRIRVAGKECQPSAKQHMRGQESPRRRANRTTD
jgi:hypothetical protein